MSFCFWLIKDKCINFYLKNTIDFLLEKRDKWRALNPHNETIQMTDFNHASVFVGTKSTGALYVFDNNQNSILRIGNNCILGNNVQFIMHRFDDTKKTDIIIGNNVTIGSNTIILCGISVGDNIIIPIGSVITKDIPNDTVIYQ
jgi:acetyltransferase-like isoleucine patch superfamily enzyme